MMKMFAVVASVVGAVAGSASAAQITFVHESSGSGTIGTQSFGATAPVNFTITATGDTTAAQSFGDGFWIDHVSASISIAGVGTFDILTGTRTFVYNLGQVVGFSRAGGTGLDLLNGPRLFPELGTWDMTTSLGPITGAGEIIQWNANPNINTSGGVLFINSTPDATVTFSATVVPAPGAVALGGVALLGASRRRR